jgi:hypothetical protein
VKRENYRQHMVTLLASLLGFIGSMFPSFIKAWQDKDDKKHELKILELQIAADKQKRGSKLEAINAYYDVESSKAIYKTYKTGISWVDSFNGTVRPAIAYGFFGLYATVKVLTGLSWAEEDHAIFAGVISFYYGQRGLYKANGNGGNGHHGNGNGKH